MDNLFSLLRQFPIRFGTLNCRTAFLHKLHMCLSKLSLKSMSTPNSLTTSSDENSMDPKLNVWDFSCIL